MGKIHLDKTEMLNLASKIIDGSASDEEIRRYNVIYHHFQQGDTVSLETEEEKLLEEQMIQQINRQLFPPATRSIRLWIRIAAALFLISSVAAGIYFLNNDRQPSNRQALVVPGGNKAILTLADGKKVVLNNATGILSYKKLKSLLNGMEPEYNAIETPKGGTYQVNLSDGTRVWLNSASKLRYPVAYHNGERIVELEGEAYFEVAKDRSRPFKVKNEGQTVEVLGTHFNVNGYDDEPFIKTTLLEGSVKISTDKNSVLIKPMQESINRAGKLSVQQTADADEAVAWKNGYFQFDDESLESVMRKISRWYDVEVEFIGKPGDKKFNGIISRSKGIKQALELMEATGNVSFKMEGRKLIVKT